ncbi:MAG: histidine kinase [Syntrophomonas sp.]|nr:histidine kinase [Syntrophomonas sp.]
MNIIEFLLYLIYGFSMITMGIFAIMQKDSRVMNISLIRSMKYLGYFGIIHGISEWISMIIKLGIYSHINIEIYYINLTLKALSFIFLFYFGLDLLPFMDRFKRLRPAIPFIILGLYLLCFTWLIKIYGVDYHLSNTIFTTVAIRYFMAIPSCAIAAAALYLNAQLIEKTKSLQISQRYKNLAWVIIVYGFVEGLLVSRAAFFPANIINKEAFPEYFIYITLSFKAIVGFIINYLLIKVIDTFSWEQEERLFRLEQLRIAAEERRKLGLEIHDTIIQELYAMGLKVGYLAKYKDKGSAGDILEEIKESITTTINKTREFISVNVLEEIALDELKDSLEQLVKRYNETQGVKIELKCIISPYIEGTLSPEKTTQIYYIVQEAITNIIRHAQADYAQVLLEGRHDFINITITDNGKGISYDENNVEQFGIRSMNERAQRINGLLKIERLAKGTSIELRIPWEGALQ